MIDLDENPDNADWLKGLRRWPLPDTLEGLRSYLKESGWPVEGFKATPLFRGWVERKPWLRDL
jgi:hypothetical protein